MTYAEREVAFVRLGRNENDRQGERLDASDVAVLVFGRRSERECRVNGRDDFRHRVRFGRIRRTERPDSGDKVLQRLQTSCQINERAVRDSRRIRQLTSSHCA